MSKDSKSSQYGAGVPSIEIVTTKPVSSGVESRGAQVPRVETVPKPAQTSQPQQGQNGSGGSNSGNNGS